MGIAIAEPSRRVVLVSGDGAAYIEVMIPAAENVPLPEEALDAYFKLRTPTDVRDPSETIGASDCISQYSNQSQHLSQRPTAKASKPVARSEG